MGTPLDIRGTDQENNGGKSRQTFVIPVLGEQVAIEKKTVETGKVTITKSVKVDTELVDVPLNEEGYTIEHVPVNEYVDGELPVIVNEGDTMIIPVLREVMVKRTLLVEHIRITKRVTETTEQLEVALRREDIDIRRG